jgi:hypothetical protein
LIRSDSGTNICLVAVAAITTSSIITAAPTRLHRRLKM